MQVGIKKITIFELYLASACVVNDATVRCCKQSAAGPWQVGDTYRCSLCTVLIETHLALLLVPFVAAPLCDSDDGILMGTYMCVTQECSLE